MCLWIARVVRLLCLNLPLARYLLTISAEVGRERETETHIRWNIVWRCNNCPTVNLHESFTSCCCCCCSLPNTRNTSDLNDCGLDGGSPHFICFLFILVYCCRLVQLYLCLFSVFGYSWAESVLWRTQYMWKRDIALSFEPPPNRNAFSYVSIPASTYEHFFSRFSSL